MPEQPARIRIGARWYVAALLEVLERDRWGRPIASRVVYDDQSGFIELGPESDVLLVWLPEARALRPRVS